MMNSLKENNYPIHMELGISSVCNVNPPCVMCGRNNIEKDSGFIEDDVLDKIKPYLKYLHEINLHGLGEVWLYPKLDEIVYLTPNCRRGFSTGGHCMTKERSRYLVDNDFAFITISIDSATKEVHDKIRGTGFNKIIENIKYLQNYKYKNKKREPEIFLDITLMKWNLLDTEDMVKLAWELDVKKIILHPMHGLFDWKIERNGNIFDYKKQMVENFPMAYDEAIVKAIKTGKELGGIEIEHYGLCDEGNLERNVIIDISDVRKTVPSSNTFEKKKRHYYNQKNEGPRNAICILPWNNINIHTDGIVKHCCFQLDELGCLKTDSYDDILFGEKSQNVRKKILNKQFPNRCINDKQVCFVRNRFK